MKTESAKHNLALKVISQVPKGKTKRKTFKRNNYSIKGRHLNILDKPDKQIYAVNLFRLLS